MIERWKPIEGFEGIYEISDLGRCRSLDRVDGHGQTRQGKVLEPSFVRGYAVVSLGSGSCRTKKIHRLVCIAFHGAPSPDKPYALHGPGGKEDNRAINLRWGSHSDNMRDKRRDGTNTNVNKTHCPQGHEYTPNNTFHQSSGSRCCLTCRRIRDRVRSGRKRKR